MSINDTRVIGENRRRATGKAASYRASARPCADVLMRCKSTDITIDDIKFIARLTTNRNLLHRIPTLPLIKRRSRGGTKESKREREREEERERRKRLREREARIGLLFWGKPRRNTLRRDKSEIQTNDMQGVAR